MPGYRPLYSTQFSNGGMSAGEAPLLVPAVPATAVLREVLVGIYATSPGLVVLKLNGAQNIWVPSFDESDYGTGGVASAQLTTNTVLMAGDSITIECTVDECWWVASGYQFTS